MRDDDNKLKPFSFPCILPYYVQFWEGDGCFVEWGGYECRKEERNMQKITSNL